LVPTQLSLADAEQDTGADQTKDATRGESHTRDEDGEGPSRNRAAIATAGGFLAAKVWQRDANEHTTCSKRSSGNAESDLRPLHANLHLVERVFVSCSWRAWRNLNTSIV
jgi:hypothetical protein